MRFVVDGNSTYQDLPTRYKLPSQCQIWCIWRAAFWNNSIYLKAYKHDIFVTSSSLSSNKNKTSILIDLMFKRVPWSERAGCVDDIGVNKEMQPLVLQEASKLGKLLHWMNMLVSYERCDANQTTFLRWSLIFASFSFPAFLLRRRSLWLISSFSWLIEVYHIYWQRQNILRNSTEF